MATQSDKPAGEKAAEGLKIRRKAQHDEAPKPLADQEAQEGSAERSTLETSPEPATTSPAEPTRESEEEVFDPSKLPRRVVDPKEDLPKTRKAESEPVERRIEFDDGATTDDFAALFEGGGETSVPKRLSFEVGEKIEGPVTHIDSTYIYVDIGTRGEARAPRAQYIDKQGELEVEVGGTHEFFVLRFTRDGIELGKHLDTKEAGLGAIEEAQSSGVPLQGRVTSKNKGGFVVDVNGVEAFCPVSQIDLHNSDDLDVYIGQTFRFRVMEVRDGGRSVVVSRAALLREEAEAAREETMARLKPGEIVTGVVRSIMDFGAFVDLGGVDGLVHISEMGWGTIDTPQDVVKEGETVEVKILDMEAIRGKRPRIGLSMKQAQEDPWERVNTALHVGKIVQGSVVRTAPFGAFVELLHGIDGLVHISELSWDHVRRVENIVSVGDVVEVEVLDIDMARQRIGLSMKNAKGDPWKEIAKDYPIGAEVTGVVEKTEDFGVFINVGQGVTALLPRSEMNLGQNETPHTRARQGAPLTARVLSVEPANRRMALTLKSGDEATESSEPEQKSYKETSASGGFGTLGDLLKLRRDD